MTKVLVIDDDKPIRRTLSEILSFEKYEVDTAENGYEGLKLLKNQKYDVVFCDIKMPQIDGLEVLEKAIEMGIEVPFVMISGHGNIQTAVSSLKMGAFDFIEKPLDLNMLLNVIKSAESRSNLIVKSKSLVKKTTSKKIKSLKTNIIGESVPILKVKEIISKVANSDARVLITGSNGSGKELVAKSIHENSSRSKAPFIDVNCAAIPSELIESELFGHEKGAFTGANTMRKGKFELANGGTLFLDELGDMSLSAQAKVLRVLQENIIQRVGSEKEIKVNVRVLAATNKDLFEEIKNHRFREDLFHRIGVILIHVPSLSERKEDIPLLLDYFLQPLKESYNKQDLVFTNKAIKMLQSLPWTGNIREFRNVVERLVVLCDTEVTDVDVKLFGVHQF